MNPHHCPGPLLSRREWLRVGGLGCLGRERGLAFVPLGRFFVGGGEGEDFAVGETRAGDHEADGEAVLAEAAGNRDGRQAEDVEGKTI